MRGELHASCPQEAPRQLLAGAILALAHSASERCSLQTRFTTRNSVHISKEFIMGILLFLLFGLVVGFIARAVMPGNQKMGLIATMILGVVGSFVGGFLVSLVTDNRVTDLHTAGMIGSIVGALVLLLVMGKLSNRNVLA
jgi:uncharacterized membrane protein YeaQ/YmgE (transglycosylase-associated protein family)